MNTAWMKHVCTMAGSIAMMISTPILISAQTTSPPPAFAVASIRRNVDNIGTCTPDQVQPTQNGFHMTNCPLLMAVGAAYVPTTGDPIGYLVQERILGMPPELARERYNIDAHIADSDAEAWRDPAQRTTMLHAMMQTLLADRCKLTVHRELKEKAIYVLLIAKNGPRLMPAKAGEVEAAKTRHPGAVAIPGGSGVFVRGQTNGHIDIYSATTGTLALLLAGPAGRPVVDKTGLTGLYDMHLDMGQVGLAPENSAESADSVFSSLQEQLGLKLESRKDDVENLIIDRIERPSAN